MNEVITRNKHGYVRRIGPDETDLVHAAADIVGKTRLEPPHDWDPKLVEEMTGYFADVFKKTTAMKNGLVLGFFTNKDTLAGAAAIGPCSILDKSWQKIYAPVIQANVGKRASRKKIGVLFGLGIDEKSRNQGGQQMLFGPGFKHAQENFDHVVTHSANPIVIAKLIAVGFSHAGTYKFRGKDYAILHMRTKPS